ncbi:MAG: hypothetical protein ACE5E0_02550 [Terriglobia bacterium]
MNADVVKEDVEKVLVRQDELEEKVRELGRRISRDYKGRSLLLGQSLAIAALAALAAGPPYWGAATAMFWASACNLQAGEIQFDQRTH